MHVHIGALNFLIDFCNLIVGLFLIRLTAARFSNHSVGRAAAALN